MLCNVMTALAIVMGGCATPQALAEKPPSFDIRLARQLINQHRAQHGLGPVAVDKRLVAAAKAHSRDLARRGASSHRGADGSLPKDRARAFGYNPRLASENVAAGYHDTRDVITGWKQSRGHNANLLRRGARHMGMALVYNPKAGQQTYWTLLMGVPR